jgi:hypothetical protein
MLGQRTEGPSADERTLATSLERIWAFIDEDECDHLFVDCCVLANSGHL